MAAAASTVAIVKCGSQDRGPWDAASDQIGNKALRWAIVAVTQDTGTYTTGGQAVDILGTLDDYGWTAIYLGQSLPFTTNSVLSEFRVMDPNNATPGSRKVTCHLTTTGAELAGSQAHTAGTWYMFVQGI